MSAYLRVVPDEDCEVLQRYLEDDNGVVLIQSSTAAAMFGEQAGELDGLDLTDYNFGGETDVWVDIVHSPSHYAAEAIRSALAEDEEDTP